MSKSQSKVTTSVTPCHLRARPLLVFSDQGASQVVPPTLFGIGGRDRSWNLHARNFLEANQPQFDVMNIQTQLCPGADEINLRLRPGGVIGAVPLRAPDTWRVAGGVVARPRFGWNDIGPLLQQIGWVASPQILAMPYVPGSAREVPPWVLAGPILHRIGRLLRQIHRGFRMHEETRNIPRGQIHWRRYITEYMERGALHCIPSRFPELGPDQLLRANLRWGLERVRCSLAPNGCSGFSCNLP
jgi:hypothetical protein